MGQWILPDEYVKSAQVQRELGELFALADQLAALAFRVLDREWSISEVEVMLHLVMIGIGWKCLKTHRAITLLCCRCLVWDGEVVLRTHLEAASILKYIATHREQRVDLANEYAFRSFAETEKMIRLGGKHPAFSYWADAPNRELIDRQYDRLKTVFPKDRIKRLREQTFGISTEARMKEVGWHHIYLSLWRQSSSVTHGLDATRHWTLDRSKNRIHPNVWDKTGQTELLMWAACAVIYEAMMAVEDIFPSPVRGELVTCRQRIDDLTPKRESTPDIRDPRP